MLHQIQIDTMHFRFKPRRNPGSQSQHRSVNRTAVRLPKTFNLQVAGRVKHRFHCRDFPPCFAQYSRSLSNSRRADACRSARSIYSARTIASAKIRISVANALSFSLFATTILIGRILRSSGAIPHTIKPLARRLIALSQVTLDSGWPCRHNPTPWPRSSPRSSNFNGAFRMKRVALGSCSSAAGRMALVAPNAAGRGPAC